MAKFYTPTKLSENIRETPEGYLLCLSVPIARTGWQQYGKDETPLEVGEDGTVWIHRDSKEVLRPETIASFQGKSITIRHPADFVKPENWQELTRGVVQNVREGDETDEDGEQCILADLLITDEMAIGLVKNGLREVSCGYEAEYEQTGEGEGRQYNIVGNHLALVEQGRAGSSYAINDHKGEFEMESLKELKDKIAGLVKTIDKLSLENKKAKAKDKAKDKGKDEGTEQENLGSQKKAKDEDSYDELVKSVKDLMERVEGMTQAGKDEDKEDKEDKADDEEEEDEDRSENETESKILERVTALEAAVAKMLKSSSGDEEEEESEDDEEESMSGSEDEEEEESEDEDKEDMNDSEEGEEGEESQKKMGDSALLEILAPGSKITRGKPFKAAALKKAYATADGKAVIDALTGGGEPDYKLKDSVNLIFKAAGVLLKEKRGTGLEETRRKIKFDDMKAFTSQQQVMTPEKMNEINAAHWAGKK